MKTLGKEWIVYMLDVVTETSELTLALIEGIRGKWHILKR